MINVLIVDDSRSVQEYLEHLLDGDSEMHVMGKLRNGREAVEFLADHQPDVITMDIQMPVMDGFEATRRIMETRPTPIVIISSLWQPREVAKTFQAMEAGAVAILEKPRGPGQPGHERSIEELLAAIRQAAMVPVRRLRSLRPAVVKREQVAATSRTKRRIRVVALGASTGGPPAIQQFLGALPADFPLPVLIVQHIATGFTDGFVEWLNSTVRMRAHVPEHGETIMPGQAYVAPDGLHMLYGSGGVIQLSNAAPEHSMRPAVSCLFRSVARNCAGAGAGVLLTGMGRDGAAELKLIRDGGGVTFAQDRATAVIFGMPGEAQRLDACTHVLSPVEIAAALSALVEPSHFC